MIHMEKKKVPFRKKNFSNKEMTKHMNQFKPGNQRHILADLKNKYGPVYGDNFLNISEVMAEFNDNFKIEGLLRTIFKARFDFTQYGKYLFHPTVMQKMLEIAYQRYAEFRADWFGVTMALNNQQVSVQIGIPFEQLVGINELNRNRMEAWGTVLRSLQDAAASMDVNPITFAVNQLNDNRHLTFTGRKLSSVL